MREITDNGHSQVPDSMRNISDSHGKSTSRKNTVLENDSCIFEKKKWISTTGLCNNNCLFCLDGWRRDRQHRKRGEIIREIKEARDNGFTKLILSGGEPTIHPNIIDFVRCGKKVGFKKIQIVSNGRMFANKNFSDDIIRAGLDEITFSIHGYNSRMHDSLTRVPGSFRQTISGVKNVFQNSKKIIVNTDTCITKLNYRQLPQIVKFLVERVGIKEINLMSMVPQGNAWKYREMILYDYNEVAPYVRSVIDYCINNRTVLWLSRFPSEYLEGYEEFIEDPYKLVDDVRGRIEMLKYCTTPKCKGEMCEYCCLKYICDDFIKINGYSTAKDKDVKDFIPTYEEHIITKHNFKQLPNILKAGKNKRILLKLAEPTKRIGEYVKIVPKISEIMSILKKTDLPNIDLTGIPFCMLLKSNIRNIRLVNFKNVDYLKYEIPEKDYLGLAEELARKVKIKRISCGSCLFFNGCPGIYQNYVRIYGFGELTPIRIGEIRINLECNQDCIFCNTDNNAENLVLQRDDVFEKIDSFAKNGINYLVISGKEPTLNKNLIDYIKFAKSRNFIKIELQTNAIKCSVKKYAKKFKDAGLTHAFVSLHASNEEMSSKITRAPGTFKATLKGLKNLSEECIGITINIVVNSINFEHLKSIVEFMDNDIHPESIIFSIVAPVVNAWKNKWIIPKLATVLPHLYEAFDYCKMNNVNFRIPSRCGLPICLVENYKENHDEFCDSRRFSDTRDKIKNESCNNCIYNSSCTGLWKKYAEIYGTSELRAIRKITDEKTENEDFNTISIRTTTENESDIPSWLGCKYGRLEFVTEHAGIIIYRALDRNSKIKFIKIHQNKERGLVEATILQSKLPLETPKLLDFEEREDCIVLGMNDIRLGRDKRMSSLPEHSVMQGAELLAKIHQLRINNLHYTDNPLYELRLRANRPYVPKPLEKMLMRICPIGDAFCHRNLHPSNWISKNGSLTGLLDFSSAGYADPEEDLAGLVFAAGGNPELIKGACLSWEQKTGKVIDRQRTLIYLWLIAVEHFYKKPDDIKLRELVKLLEKNYIRKIHIHGNCRHNKYVKIRNPNAKNLRWISAKFTNKRDILKAICQPNVLGPVRIDDIEVFVSHACNDLIRMNVDNFPVVVKIYNKKIKPWLFELERYLSESLANSCVKICCPIELRNGSHTFRINGRIAAIYPYAGNNKIENNFTDIIQIAKALATFHNTPTLEQIYSDMTAGYKNFLSRFYKLVIIDKYINKENAVKLSFLWRKVNKQFIRMEKMKLPISFVHGSFHRDHLLRISKSKLAIFDPEKISISPRIFDVARTAMYVGYRSDEKLNLKKIICFLNYYNKENKFTKSEISLLVPIMLNCMFNDLEAMIENDVDKNHIADHVNNLLNFDFNNESLNNAFIKYIIT